MVSVIVPVYNVETNLRQCIYSVISQTYSDWELLLIDDGSKDGSGLICDEYAMSDDRIKVIHKQNGGVSSARNKGLDIAQGEWITFIDSDDWLDKDALEIYTDAIARTGSDMIKTCHRNHYKDYIEENPISEDVSYTDHSDMLAALERSRYFSVVCNSFIRSSIAKKFRFNTNISWLEDVFYGYECLMDCKKITLPPLCVYNYRKQENGTLSSVKNPFVIAYSAQIEFEYKMKILDNRNNDVLKKSIITYHMWLSQAINSLYNSNFNYKERKRFKKMYYPIDGIFLYPEEKKMFQCITPFWLNDLLELFKIRIRHLFFL